MNQYFNNDKGKHFQNRNVPSFEDICLFFSGLQRIQQFSKTIANRRKRYQSRFFLKLN